MYNNPIDHLPNCMYTIAIIEQYVPTVNVKLLTLARFFMSVRYFYYNVACFCKITFDIVV